MPEEKMVSITSEEEKRMRKFEDIYYNRNQDVLWITETIKPDEILQTVYEHCIEMGADAFINFEYDTIELPSRNSISEYETKFYIVSGFAIKRIN